LLVELKIISELEQHQNPEIERQSDLKNKINKNKIKKKKKNKP